MISDHYKERIHNLCLFYPNPNSMFPNCLSCQKEYKFRMCEK
jgi:hypothetical protein